MKLSLLALLWGVLVCPNLIAGQEMSLFNGKDLSGWRGDAKYWSVKDGVIFGQSTKENPTGGNFLVWDGEVSDFDITLMARVRGNNSGLQYRSRVVNEERFMVFGYQADLIHAQHLLGMLYYQGDGRGIVAQRFQQVEVDASGQKKVISTFGDKDLKWDANDWIELRVVAVGNRIIHQVNGVTTVDVTENHPKAMKKGVLALQLHGGAPMTAEFKDIRLTKLDGDAAQKTLKEVLQQKENEKFVETYSFSANYENQGQDVNFMEGKVAHWIWEQNKKDDSPLYLTKNFNVEGDLKNIQLLATCDNELKIWLNGHLLGESKQWEKPIKVGNAIKKHFVQGQNLIAVEANNAGGLAAFILKLHLTYNNDKVQEVVSDTSWKASESKVDKWNSAIAASQSWEAPLKSFGALGVSPWGGFGYEVSTTKKDAKLGVIDGFKVEEIFQFPAEKGSMVTLTQDDQGRIYVSGQRKKGLHRLDLNFDRKTLTMEQVPMTLEGTRGMLWHDKALFYYHTNKGLMRLWDSDGDDRLDKSELYNTAYNGSEHGSHSVILDKNGKDFIMIGGNHTPITKQQFVERNRVQSWKEDLLLQREWDGNGHARGVYAPGGHIVKFNMETKKNEIISMGYRNQFDAAYNIYGDLFTYDADMEWDMGTPWYRPTRINFVASGADYGWRSGSGKWPSYFEDSLPAVYDIGPGSPTGMVSGLKAKFPAKYQKAVYAFDWTFGTIHAMHFTPDGAGYKAERETFCFGAPLPLTDGLVAKDGSLYFLTGGRGTDSRLFRITYEGNESTAAVAVPTLPEAHKQRRALEKFHGVKDAKAVAQAWPFLASKDRWLRHAARVAIESQDVNTWADRVNKEENAQARITAAIALARTGNATHKQALVKALQELNFDQLSDSEKLAYLRAYGLVFMRLEAATQEEGAFIAKQLLSKLPTKNNDLNTELVRLLVYVKAPGIIEVALKMVEDTSSVEKPNWQSSILSRNKNYARAINATLADYPPVRQLNYAFMLRNLDKGWTLDQRRRYIAFLNRVAKHKAGHSYSKFLINIRGQILAQLSNDERKQLEDITGEDFNNRPNFKVTPPKGPGRNWTVKEAMKYAGGRHQLKDADLKNGRNVFHAIACASCHRFDGLGGDIGPDLTMVRTKFDNRYILESIIEPSKIISDQYGSKILTLKDKSQVSGLIIQRDGYYDVYPTTKTSKELKPRRVKYEDVEKVEQSPYSQMPPMLINTLSEKELKDLMAYLLSSGVK